ncbi:N-acetyl-alpha-D-glucosaminyl L-malate synthase BshA [Deinococcus cellulosilyticus]|uniref:N-acetyl-alpha-D-glucosaminyl L-malate synthase BshA n=1 Tax=Deinococcus cellulosilyticus (strain DSM 18568 / NBRC 106333 / KACC 11606 / 5516J-15) TaxID=1223518 RepID=A0A511MYB2_DEIC1|nr:N-acetyl-alpha-D-glucosaminyl L-malate synthase BshA [Deinococcus cellulosilyticus]GEM45127.1 N-acetyl-alpha-D-glucosaminyl L-malate synthase BshA [Deinococcus cellulosilyticus NBRC 106333 = KACC 11606]
MRPIIERVNIAILCHATAGGSGVVATELGVELAQHDHEVHFVSTAQPFRLSALDCCTNVFFHQVGRYEYPLFEQALTTINTANTLAEVIQEHDIQITHAHYAIPYATSALMAQDITGRTKVVTTLHGTDVTLVGLDPAFRHSTRHAIQKSGRVTAVSQFLANHTSELFKLDVPIEVIYNFVDIHRFQRNTDARYRARFAHPEEKILLHLSNFRGVKRTLDVIEIFARVQSEVPSRLLMVGDGPDRSRAFELAQKLGVIGRVHFLGSYPSVETIMGIADVFLLPSSQESFGLVALEAMSCGVPVVSSNVGGIPEVNIQGETGFMCPVGDVDGMAHATLQLLQNETLHREMGGRARSRAVDHFQPHHIVPQYLRVYEDLLTE